VSLVPDLNLKRKVGWKDIVITALAVLVLLLGMVVVRENVSFAAWMARFGAGGKPVVVFDVQVDREGRRFIDLLFDMPIGEGHELRLQVAGTLHFHPMVYVSTQPGRDPCRRSPMGTECGWPVGRLRPNGVLVVWENRGYPGWSLASSMMRRLSRTASGAFSQMVAARRFAASSAPPSSQSTFTQPK